MRLKALLKVISLPVIAASLCCLSPLILVLFGLSTISFAASLADTLYFGYKWVFRSVGLLFLLLALWWYWRKQGVCSLDEAKRRKNEVVNSIVLTLTAGVAGYFFFLYVVVHYAGVWLAIWE